MLIFQINLFVWVSKLAYWILFSSCMYDYLWRDLFAYLWLGYNLQHKSFFEHNTDNAGADWVRHSACVCNFLFMCAHYITFPLPPGWRIPCSLWLMLLSPPPILPQETRITNTCCLTWMCIRQFQGLNSWYLLGHLFGSQFSQVLKNTSQLWVTQLWGRRGTLSNPGRVQDSGVRRWSVNSAFLLFPLQNAENLNCFHFLLLKVIFRTVINIIISKPSSQIK